MAAGVLPAPESIYGPCKDECVHTDCEMTRSMAAAVCSICGEEIGYECRFYGNTLDTMVHASCREAGED